jgi:hypothetical protein
VVEKRGSRWMSPDLGNLCALRCWLGFEVCYEGSSDVPVARADDVDPFPSLRVLGPEEQNPGPRRLLLFSPGRFEEAAVLALGPA